MKIHWVGGQLPKVGKAWTARALIEGLYLVRGIQVVTIDTSYGSPLSKLYNPGLLDTYSPDRYFTTDGFREYLTDDIYYIAQKYPVLVVKLASYSQQLFFEWIESSGIVQDSIDHEFWFVSNGRSEGLSYFQEICTLPWQIHFVKNNNFKFWHPSLPTADRLSDNIDRRILPATITNPQEIELIETSRQPLTHLAAPKNPYLYLSSRTRISRFLHQSSLNLLDTLPALTIPDREVPNTPSTFQLNPVAIDDSSVEFTADEEEPLPC
jgi:hypothetical protein